jgi:hypothetical protein
LQGLVEVPREAETANVRVELLESGNGAPIDPLELKNVPVEIDWSRYRLIAP